MKKYVLIPFFILSIAHAQQTPLKPYKVKEEGKPYELKQNAGLNKFQRINRNEEAIRLLFQKIEKLEERIKNLESAKKN